MSSVDKLKPYTEYKDSGLTWVGRVPKTWEVRKLSNFGSTFGGGTPSTENPDYWGGDVVWATPKDLSSADTEYIYNSSRKITLLGQQYASILLPANSILFGCRAPVGNVAISGIELTTNQGFISLVPNENNLTRFIFFLLNATKKEIQNESSGTTFQEISRSKLQNLKFPQPPLETQQRIVDYLDEETTRIDNTVGEMRTLVNLLQEKRKVLISEVVTKGIPGEHAEFKDSSIGELPLEWNKTKMARIANWWNGYGFKPEDLGAKGTPVVRIRELIQEDLELDKTELKNFPPEILLTAGDLIFSWSMTLLSKFWTREDAVLNQHLYKVVPKEGYEIKWIHYCLIANLGALENQMHGSAAKHLTRKNLLKFEIVAPPLKEQQRIAAYLDEETSKIDTLIEETEKAIELLQEERKALIREVVTGQLEV